MNPPAPDQTEHPLTGGNVAASVVRIAGTVRKPVTSATPDVEAFLQYLERSGFRHAPRTLGRDPQGRHILQFIPGQTITEPELLTPADLQQIAIIIRNLHRISASFVPPQTGQWHLATTSDLVCHNDLGPWNLVRNGSNWVFIDWDGAGPSTRLWDLAYAAQSIVHLAHGGNPQHDATRLRTFLQSYGLTPAERAAFPQLLLDRTRFSHAFLQQAHTAGTDPWSAMYTQGHGKYWHRAAAYIEQHMSILQAALQTL